MWENVMVDLSRLAPCWRVRTQKDAPADWYLPEGVNALVFETGKLAPSPCYASEHRRRLNRWAKCYYILKENNTIGPRVDRPISITTYEWPSVPQLDDDGPFVLLLKSLGTVVYPKATPAREMIEHQSNSVFAWTTQREFTALMYAAPQIVEATTEDYLMAAELPLGTAVAARVLCLNECLRARVQEQK
jgi:hypothetical protein